MENINELTVAQIKAELEKLGKTEEDLKGLLKPDLVKLLTDLTAEPTDDVDLASLDKAQLLELLKQQDKVVDELKQQIDYKKDVRGSVVVKHGKDSYKFVVPKFTLPAFGETIAGKQYTAEEAAENPEVIAQLVKIKSGVLKKVN